MHNKVEQSTFKVIQYAFTQHIRNPGKHARPGDIEPRRMQIYNELLYNNVEDFMASAFPVLKSISSEEKWQRMIRDYFEHHHAATPLFHEMPREFLKYLMHEKEPEEDDYPFLQELAHYEWAELALTVTDTEIDFSNIDIDGDLLEGVPVLSPNAWPLSYVYPVHQICKDFLPDKPGKQPTNLVVYRNQQDAVHFLEINTVTAYMLQMISGDNRLNSKAILLEIAEKLNHPNPEVVIQGGLQILHDLKARDVIPGVKVA